VPSSVPIPSTLVNASPSLSGAEPNEVHVQPSMVSCQSCSPTNPEKVGDLQGIKIMEKIKPAFKFSGHANEITFEKFMERMEAKTEGVQV
jgi:hypothetical protein